MAYCDALDVVTTMRTLKASVKERIDMFITLFFHFLSANKLTNETFHMHTQAQQDLVNEVSLLNTSGFQIIQKKKACKISTKKGILIR